MNIVALYSALKIRLGLLEVTINLDDTYPPNPVTLSPILVDISPIKLGSDEDSDIILSAGQVSINLYFDDTNQSILGYYRFIHQQIKSGNRSVKIHLNSQLIWQGYIDNNTDKLQYDPQKKTIKINAIEQIVRLKNIDPKLNPFGYSNLSQRKKIVDIILDIITANSIYDSFVQEVVPLSTLQGYAVVNGQWMLYDFPDFMAKLNYYFGTDSNYENMLVLLKAIALNYNLIIYAGLDRKLYLLPRFAEYNEVDVIDTADLITKPQYKIIDKINGLKVRLWTGMYPKDNNYYTYYLGDYTPNDKLSEDLTIDQPCGIFPGYMYSNIEIIDGGNYYYLEEENVRHRKMDGSFTSFQSLYNIVANNVWDEIKYPRLKCSVEVSGFYDRWNPSKYYVIEGDENIYRATSFEYDLIHNKTKINLKQASNLVYQLPPGDYRLTEDGGFRLIEDGSIRLI